MLKENVIVLFSILAFYLFFVIDNIWIFIAVMIIPTAFFITYLDDKKEQEHLDAILEEKKRAYEERVHAEYEELMQQRVSCTGIQQPNKELNQLLQYSTYQRQQNALDEVPQIKIEDIPAVENQNPNYTMETEAEIEQLLEVPTYERHRKPISEAFETDTSKNPTAENKSDKQSTPKSKRSYITKILNYFGGLWSDYRFSQLQKKDKSQKCLIGVGGGASNILHDILRITPKHNYVHINSDYNALVQKDSEFKILLQSKEKNDKWGCGGNIECGKSLIDNTAKEKIKEYSEDFHTVHLIATLGGGVSSGATPEVVKCLQEIGKEVHIFVTLPFRFEGKVRKSNAEEALNILEKLVDKVYVVDNNQALKSKKGIREALAVVSRAVYKQIVLSR